MDLRAVGIVLIFVAVTLLTVAQLLIKSRLTIHGVMPILGGEIVVYLVKLVRDWKMWLGIFVLIFSALAWYSALSRLPLSAAYPITSLSYVFIFVGAIIFLGESFSWTLLAGNLLIVTGVVLVSLAR